MSSGSAIRPFPDSPLASSPVAGSRIVFPNALKVSIFIVVAGCFSMSMSMEGAMKTGHLAERYVVSRRLSAMPLAIFATEFAVAGAIRKISAHNPRSTWLFQSPLDWIEKFRKNRVS